MSVLSSASQISTNLLYILLFFQQNERLRNELDKPPGSMTPNKTILNAPISTNILDLDDIDGGRPSLLSTSPLAVANTAINTGASPKIKKNILSSNNTLTNASPNRIVNAGSEHLPLRVQKKWEPPLLGPLPPGFLRLSLNEVSVSLSASIHNVLSHLLSMSTLTHNRHAVNTIFLMSNLL